MVGRISSTESSTLDAMRAVAAQMVCVGHAVSLAGLYPSNLPYVQSLAVVVFFVLSGYLIAHTLWQNRERGPAHFMVMRFARIYSAYAPSLVLIVLIEGVMMLNGTHPAPQYYTWNAFFSSLTMFQGWRGAGGSFLSGANFGTAGHLWTIAIEFHIYLFVGGLFFLAVQRRSIWLVAPVLFFSYWPLELVAGSYGGTGMGTALFSVWLVGFAAYFAMPRLPAPRRGVAIALALACFAAWGASIPVGRPYAEYVWWTYPPLLASFVFAMLASRSAPPAPVASAPAGLRKVVTAFAEYSFTLYLIHLSICGLVVQLLKDQDRYVQLAAMVIVSNVAAFGLARVTERHYRGLGNWLLKLAGSRVRPATA